jgi:general L-amino acid transport system substrate-binding protein
MPVPKTASIVLRLLTAVCAAAAAAGFLPEAVSAGETLARVRSAGVVRCGVNDGLPGFAVKDEAGRWSGMNVDFCRAAAAAVLGDPGKVDFIPLIPSARFPVLKSKKIDLLVRSTTWTFAREAGLEVQFAGVLYYDGQSFMVPRSSPARTLQDLNGATICVVKGTTHELNLADHFGARGMTGRSLMEESNQSAWQAYRDGRCTALTGDASALAAMRLQAAEAADAHLILPFRISKEPLGPVVNRGDEEWFTIVRWVLFALIEAEERGITRANVRKARESADDPALAAFLGKTSGPGKALGLSADWVTRVLESVGNYAEIYERHLGRQSPLQLERGLNRLWKDGGLMVSPPFR